MKYDTVVWDWNGTLFDDLPISVDVINTLLSQEALPTLPDADAYRAVFRFPVIDCYIDLGFDFSKTPFAVLADRYIETYNALRPRVRLTHGAVEALEAVQARGIRQVVLSAGKQDQLMEQMSPFPILHYFSEILGVSDHYGHSKRDLAVNWMAAHGLDPQRTLFIGDAVHDFEVASACGADCLLVTTGHQSEARLRATGAPVIHALSEVPGILI
ncbi:MAG: HAD family hydrolase [Butyricicoccus sp.]|nr:HAD family hydrolase [Butyricicoccus sp.]MBQ8586200.1 HAD family hydrolase [Butyricicoccus sp.]